MLLKDDENSPESLAHPDQGPFQVVQDKQAGLLLANATKVVAPLPFPSILTNPLHPWTFDYENCSKHVNGSSATSSPPASTTPTEMDVDPNEQSAIDPEGMDVDQLQSKSPTTTKHPSSEKKKKKKSPIKDPSKSPSTTPSPKTVKRQSLLNFSQSPSASSGQSSPDSTTEKNTSPSASENASPAHSEQPASVLKNSSYATPAQNHVPPIEAVEQGDQHKANTYNLF
jgi:hypothetical protein